MNLNCDIVMDMVSLYNDGSVSGSSRKAIAKHLQKCPECRKFYKEYRAEMKRGFSSSGVLLSDEEQIYNAFVARLNRRRMFFTAGLMLYSGFTIGVLTWLLLKQEKQEAK